MSPSKAVAAQSVLAAYHLALSEHLNIKCAGLDFSQPISDPSELEEVCGSLSTANAPDATRRSLATKKYATATIELRIAGEGYQDTYLIALDWASEIDGIMEALRGDGLSGQYRGHELSRAFTGIRQVSSPDINSWVIQQSPDDETVITIIQIALLYRYPLP